MKPQVYVDSRPPEHFARYHARVRRGRPDLAYEFVRSLLTPYLLFFFRARCIDSGNVPRHGGALIAPNHFSFLDHFFVAIYLRRKVQFMAKSQLFQRPLQFIYSHGGVFPVLRGKRDEEAFETARTVLGRGDLVVMYAEGGRSRTGALGDPKPGIGRLALETGLPVVPTAIAGSSGVRNWKRLKFPKVTVHFGRPIRFPQISAPTRDQAQAASEVIFDEIKGLYDSLQTHGRRQAVKAARAARRGAAGATAQRSPATG
jgi:1-acyl-sn-glycerol-3-phosphate acyltransferase